MAGEPQRPLTVTVAGLAADLATVDALARLALAARRSAREVRLRGASPELLGLIELVGLANVLCAEEQPVPSDALAISGMRVERARSALPSEL